MAIPPWVAPALLCAVAWSASDAFARIALRRHSLRAVFLARWGYALPVLGAAALSAPVPAIEPRFWWVLLLSAPLEIIAGLLYLESIRISPLSLVVPLLAWTPVFTAFFSLLFLGEVPSPAGGAGIAAVAAGSYLLASRRGAGLAEPVLALGKDRGCRMMLGVALIYSITSALGKIGVLGSSPRFFGLAYSAWVGFLGLAVFSLRDGRRVWRSVAPDRWLFAVGAATGAMILLHFTAISMTQVAYMISVKRTSLLFSVILGGVLFGEERMGVRAFGAALMLAGMALVSLQP